MERDDIDSEVCTIMIDHGPDGHIDGHELLTEMVQRRVAAAVSAEREKAVAEPANEHLWLNGVADVLHRWDVDDNYSVARAASELVDLFNARPPKTRTTPNV